MTTTTMTTPHTDSFLISPETEKGIVSVDGSHNNNSSSEFCADEDELAAAFDGMFDEGVDTKT